MIKSIACAMTIFLVPGAAIANTGATTTENESPVAADAPEAWQAQDGDVIAFEVLRKGKPFGTHTVRFGKDGDGTLTADTEVHLKAGLGPITVFKYDLNSSEVWKDGALLSVEGQTNDDGKKSSVTASLQDGVLNVNGTDYQGTAPVDIIPSSHWNIREVYSSSILSTESGELLKTNVERIGPDTVSVGGEDIPATHYRLKSDLTVDIWYDDQNRWVKLSFEARGQQIDYKLTKLY